MQHDTDRTAYEALAERLRAWAENDADPAYFQDDALSCVLLDCGAANEAILKLIAENERMRDEWNEAQDEINNVRDDSAEQMRMLDAIASKLGLAHDEGLEDAAPFLAAIDRLLIAFHDAIRRPLGVTPDSGAEFYDPRMADEAEARRAAQPPAKAASTAWPSGCIKPGSCSRHRQCMYARSVEQCRHFGEDLTQAVEAATRDREWAAAQPKERTQP